MVMFLETLTKTITIKTPNMVYVNEKGFNNYGFLYTVEMVKKMLFHNNILENIVIRQWKAADVKVIKQLIILLEEYIE